MQKNVSNIINALYFTSYLHLNKLKLAFIIILAGQVRPIRKRVQRIRQGLHALDDLHLSGNLNEGADHGDGFC